MALSECAQEMEEIWIEKKSAKAKSENSGKQSITKTFSNPPSKRTKDFRSQFVTIA